jgi:hypothetical protein
MKNFGPRNGWSTVSPLQHIDTTMEMRLLKALSPVHREVRSRCEPSGLRVFHPEDGGSMFLRNIGSYTKHMTSSYPRRRHFQGFTFHVSVCVAEKDATAPNQPQNHH